MELLKQQVKYLTENGFNEQQANTLVNFHQDNIVSFLATKRDTADIYKAIEQLRIHSERDIADVRKEIADVRKEIADVYKSVEQLRADNKRDIADVYKSVEQLRADNKRDIADVYKSVEQLRADNKRDIADVYKSVEQLRADNKRDIELLKRDLTLKLGSIMVGGVVVLSAIMKFL